MYDDCRLPDDYSFLRGEIHFVAGFYVKSGEERVDIAKSSVDAPFAERMRVGLGAEQNLFVADISGPDVGVCQIEPLVRRESVDWLCFRRA